MCSLEAQQEQFNSTQGVIAKSGDRPMGYIGPDRIGALQEAGTGVSVSDESGNAMA